jgi:CBS domain containing-hemolysin-like protein
MVLITKPRGIHMELSVSIRKMKTKEVDLPLEKSRAGYYLEVVPIPLAVKLLLILVFVLLNSFFAAAEFAISKIRTGRLHSLAGQGHVRARFASKIAGSPKPYLSACQLGITLSSLGLGLIGVPALYALLEPVLLQLGASDTAAWLFSFILGLGMVAALHVTIGEQVPKISSTRKPEAVALWAAAPLTLFFRLTLPFNWLLEKLTNWLLIKAGAEPEADREAAHSEEEIRRLMKESRNSGMLDTAEFALVDNIIGFSETTAREVMIPRTEMVCLYAGLTYKENMAIAMEEMLTRYPVCDPDKDNLIGFIHIKDLLHADAEQGDIRRVIRPLMSVPESISISVLLQLMQKRRTQIALLIDEYGGTSGLVTVEDILEEIVGEIQDEFDEERPSIETAGADAYSVNGLLLIEEVNEQLGLCILSEDYDTIGGWLYAQLESPPYKHQRVRLGACELTVEEVEHLRISRILIRRLAAGEGETVA